MLIKICGLTRAADAQAAVRHGATAVGFIFWPGSPRVIAPRDAASIIASLPDGVLSVGVFVNQDVPVLRAMAAEAGVKAVQLHGDETPEVAVSVGLPVIKAMGVAEAASAQGWPPDTLILVDTVDPVARGGTGRPVDWTAARAVSRERRVLLAGGLTPDNVFDAAVRVRPFGVDVSSGVERAPGVKDDDKMRRFIAEARRALGEDGAAGGNGSERRGGER